MKKAMRVLLFMLAVSVILCACGGKSEETSSTDLPTVVSMTTQSSSNGTVETITTIYTLSNGDVAYATKEVILQNEGSASGTVPPQVQEDEDPNAPRKLVHKSMGFELTIPDAWKEGRVRKKEDSDSLSLYYIPYNPDKMDTFLVKLYEWGPEADWIELNAEPPEGHIYVGAANGKVILADTQESYYSKTKFTSDTNTKLYFEFRDAIPELLASFKPVESNG